MERKEREMWDAVIGGQALGLERGFTVGIFTAKQTVEECDRLLNHERGCPSDVAEKLRELRRQASAHLQ